MRRRKIQRGKYTFYCSNIVDNALIRFVIDFCIVRLNTDCYATSGVRRSVTHKFGIMSTTNILSVKRTITFVKRLIK